MPHTYDYYISKGFDEKAASYFAGGRRKPVSVVPKDGFELLITFDNSEKRILDIGKYIKEGTVYYPLRDENLFAKCYIDADSSVCWDKDSDADSNCVWSNKIDIGADTCYLESRIF